MEMNINTAMLIGKLEAENEQLKKEIDRLEKDAKRTLKSENELFTNLLQLHAQEAILREALIKTKRIAMVMNTGEGNEEMPWTEGCRNIIHISREALSSTDINYYKVQLEDVEEVLGVLTDFEFACHPKHDESACYCFYCREVYYDYSHLKFKNTIERKSKHTKDCKLSALITKLEKRRNKLMEEI